MRALIAPFLIFYTSSAQVTLLEPEIMWGRLHRGVYGLANGVTFAVFVMLASVVTGVFPIPFAFLTLAVPTVWVATFTAYWLFYRGKYEAHVHQKTIQGMLLFSLEVTMLVLYSTFSGVFTQLSADAQILCALLMVVLRVFLKNLLHASSRHLSDLSVTLIVFNVELFHAFFSSMCMRSATVSTMVMGPGSVNLILRRVWARRKRASVSCTRPFRRSGATTWGTMAL